jgi:hypothetical protein
MQATHSFPFLATRRGLFRLAGATAAFTALAQLRGVPCAAVAADARDGFFSPSQQEILTQIVERMVASGDPRMPRVRDTHALATIDALCGTLDPSVTQPLPALLHVVDYAPFVFELKLARFTQLAPLEQDASLEGWMRSRLALRRQAFYALRNLAFLGYYSQEETWTPIGYAGPLLREKGDAA